MAKINKEEQWRREGIAYALKIAKERGIEGLEEELKYRNISLVPIAVSKEKMDECVNNIKLNTIDTMLILSASTLRDEFEFDKDKIAQFIERFNLKAECLVDGWCTWNDQIQTLAEECGIELSIRHNNKDVKI